MVSPMRIWLLGLLTLLIGCSSVGSSPIMGSIGSFLATRQAAKLDLVLVNAYHTAAQFSQQSRCGEPFPFTGGGWSLQGNTSVETFQTGPSCFGSGQFDILAGWKIIKYDCQFDIVQGKRGLKFLIAWQGPYARCSVVRLGSHKVEFIWNLE